MEIKIQAVNFDAQEKLQEFVNKKVEKLSKSYDDIKKVEVQLKVVKPATALNKNVSMNVGIPGVPVFVEKTCDTFEEGVDLCVDALKVKLAKIKEEGKKRPVLTDVDKSFQMDQVKYTKYLISFK